MINDVCEICFERLKLDTHHMHSLSLGGKDVAWNKCRLCPNCHRKVHMGAIIIEGKFASTHAFGYLVVWRNKGEESVTGFEDPPVWLYPDCTPTEDTAFIDPAVIEFVEERKGEYCNIERWC